MSKVVCANKKPSFRNLTVGKEYDNVVEEGETYLVTNDIGIRAKYAKHYFRAVPEAAPITSLQVSVARSATTPHHIVITISGMGRGRANANVTVMGQRAYNSCGIYEIQGLSGMKATANNVRGALPESAFTGTAKELFDTMLAALITFLREDVRGAYITFSDVTANDEEVSFYEYLTTHSIFNDRRMNLNSNNMITFWVLPNRVE